MKKNIPQPVFPPLTVINLKGVKGLTVKARTSDF
jgi:hypothetical protein